jgi:glycosyltransferase involved in cell wall biosynthesis
MTARQDFWWYPVGGRRRARNAHADVYHSPSPRGPLTRGSPPTVVAVHDLASFRYPETLTRWSRLYERPVLPRIAQAADRIITGSEDTAADLETILHVPREKIRIVPYGVDPIFFRPATTNRLLPFAYVLFVGTPQPRKNLDRLAAAVDALGGAGRDLRLVVAGGDGWGRVALPANVTVTGRVTDEDLLSFYQHAECLALVSLHEGFGLPAVEAMAAGTPVVVSNAGALPEVAGGAAVIVDPLDKSSIGDGIARAMANRSNLIAAGRARAAQFTWERAAELHMGVYRELV